MSKFINPKTGMPQEDRRGTIPENSLENKISFSIGKMYEEMQTIKKLYKQDYNHLNQRQTDTIEAVRNEVSDLRQELESAFKDFESDLLKDFKHIIDENSKEHSAMKKFMLKLRDDLHERISLVAQQGCDDDEELEKRIEALESVPLQQAKKIVGFSSDLFWKMVIPILTAGGTALILTLLNGGA